MKKIQDFRKEVIKSFGFLVTELNYEKIDDYFVNVDYHPDKTYMIRFLSSNLLIEVGWYFAGAIIGVSFIEKNGEDMPKKWSFFESENTTNRAVDIYTLNKFLNVGDNLILLKNTNNVTYKEVKIREKIISNKLPEIINGLAMFTKIHAKEIISGNTSSFRKLVNFHEKIIRELYN